MQDAPALQRIFAVAQVLTSLKGCTQSAKTARREPMATAL